MCANCCNWKNVLIWPAVYLYFLMFCMILTVFYVPVTSVNSINLAIFIIRWEYVLCEVRTAVFLCVIGNTDHTCVAVAYRRVVWGVQTPPQIPKALQNRAKLNPIVKTVKNC